MAQKKLMTREDWKEDRENREVITILNSHSGFDVMTGIDRKNKKVGRKN